MTMHDDDDYIVACTRGCGVIVQSVHDFECAYGGWHDGDMVRPERGEGMSIQAKISAYEPIEGATEDRIALRIPKDEATRLAGRRFGEPVTLVFDDDEVVEESPREFLKARQKARAGNRLRVELHMALEAYDHEANSVTFGEFLEMLRNARANYDAAIR